MKPLIVLIVVFAVVLAGSKIFYADWNLIFAGNIAMSLMLIFTSMGHFAFPKGMALMIPKPIPYKTTLVYLTGIIEVTAAIGLMIPYMRYTTAIFLLIFFIIILPANIYAAIHKVNFEKETYDGSGISYLWFRIPLQLLFIGWVWYFGL
jgi:uncharacterized membrane protein